MKLNISVIGFTLNCKSLTMISDVILPKNSFYTTELSDTTADYFLKIDYYYVIIWLFAYCCII